MSRGYTPTFDAEEKNNLERVVQGAGFNARIKDIPNSIDLESIAREHQLYHDYDLILLDYRLENELGDALAPIVRDLFPATTILFYSGNFQESELRKMIASREVEGVFCSHRTRFIERAGSLINQTAQALNRLSGMRGLAMRVVAECDDVLRSSVKDMSAKSESCQKCVSSLDASVLEFLETKQRAYEEAIKGNLDDRLKTFVIDSNKLHRHFRLVTREALKEPDKFSLSDESIDRIRELLQSSKHYSSEVLDKRNVLGHAVETRTDKGWEIVGNTDISVSDFPDMRQIFANHIRWFREIREILCGTDSAQS